MSYTATIGLEVHAELKTHTKLFCNSKNDPDEKRPNWNICPVCMGHPGTLPVINKAAIRHVLRMGLAVGGKIADYTEFDRKNYFYPDIPKGYQISQFAYPLVSGGELASVALTRIHLEEDTARSTHPKDNSLYSLLDFNRAGVSLMELVTEPVMHSAEEAGAFARELQLLLRYLGAGDANLEKGEMRVEANISVSRDDHLGTKVEVKNLNSFRIVEKAIIYEIARQSKKIDEGDTVVQETRGWNEDKQQTFAQRLKEESHDYRYFSDPDIPKLKISEESEFSHEALKKNFPELPWEKRERYRNIGKDSDISEFKINPEYIEMFVADERYGKMFDDAYRIEPNLPKLIANYIGSDIAGLVAKFGDKGLENISSKGLSGLVKMVSDDKISSRGAKDILAHMMKEGGAPEDLAEKLGLLQKSSEEDLIGIIRDLLIENPQVVEDYQAGKESSIQYLVGQGMKVTKGSANPSVLKKLLEREMKKGK